MSNMISTVRTPSMAARRCAPVLTAPKVRGTLLAAFALLAVLFLFRSYPSQVPTHVAPLHDHVNGPRIAKVSMLYGDPVDPLYERALRSHRLHNERWNYPMHVLRRHITGGYWNKPSYLLGLVVAELAKPVEERVEWLMWVDADLILINPSLPLSIFLPPYDFPYVHYLGNKDFLGLNTGTFFLHVHPWSVSMLTKAMAMPMFLPDLDLGPHMDQVAMEIVLNETQFSGSGEVLYMPRPWFNTYEWRHGYEGKKGDLLVHFPGLEDVRMEHMGSWLEVVEDTPGLWAVEVGKTRYPVEVKGFWERLREGRKVLEMARKVVDGGGGGEGSGEAKGGEGPIVTEGFLTAVADLELALRHSTDHHPTDHMRGGEGHRDVLTEATETLRKLLEQEGLWT